MCCPLSGGILQISCAPATAVGFNCHVSRLKDRGLGGSLQYLPVYLLEVPTALGLISGCWKPAWWEGLSATATTEDTPTPQ